MRLQLGADAEAEQDAPRPAGAGMPTVRELSQKDNNDSTPVLFAPHAVHIAMRSVDHALWRCEYFLADALAGSLEA